MVMCDGPLVVLRGADVLRDSRVLVVAVVVAPHRLGVVQELPGKQRLHLKHTEVRSSNTRTSAVERRPVSAISQIFSGLLSCSMCTVTWTARVRLCLCGSRHSSPKLSRIWKRGGGRPWSPKLWISDGEGQQM